MLEETPQFPADLVTFTEEILNEKLHFLCGVNSGRLPVTLIDLQSVTFAKGQICFYTFLLKMTLTQVFYGVFIMFSWGIERNQWH